MAVAEPQSFIEQFLCEYTGVMFVGVVAISYITGCLQVYGLYLFKRNERLLIIQKRYPQLVMMESVACIIGLFVTSPLDYNTDIHAVTLSSSEMNQIIRYFGIVILSFTNYFIVIIESLRLWLISYDLHYLSSSKNQQWKSQIDISYADKDWYLRNRGKWGSKQYIGKYAAIYFLVCSTTQAIVHVAIECSNRSIMWVYHCTNSAFSLPALFTVFYVYFKTPKQLQDEFLFQYEFKRTMIIWATGFVFYAVSFWMEHIGYLRLSLTLTSLVTICSLYSPALLSTVWIPSKIRSMNAWNGKHKMMRLKQSKTTKKQRGKQPVNYLKKLRQTLNDEAKFQTFIDWMHREFSSEVILSFVEFIQFKQWLKEEIRKPGGMAVSRSADKFDYKFYHKMPRSSIVYDELDEKMEITPSPKATSPKATKEGVDAPVVSETASLSKQRDVYVMNVVLEISEDIDTLSRAKRIAHLLFKKYIKDRAEYEINISGVQRDRYTQLNRSKYAGLDLLQFVGLFDELIGEMLMYINHSFFRFYISRQ